MYRTTRQTEWQRASLLPPYPRHSTTTAAQARRREGSDETGKRGRSAHCFCLRGTGVMPSPPPPGQAGRSIGAPLLSALVDQRHWSRSAGLPYLCNAPPLRVPPRNSLCAWLVYFEGPGPACMMHRQVGIGCARPASQLATDGRAAVRVATTTVTPGPGMGEGGHDWRRIAPPPPFPRRRAEEPGVMLDGRRWCHSALHKARSGQWACRLGEEASSGRVPWRGHGPILPRGVASLLACFLSHPKPLAGAEPRPAACSPSGICRRREEEKE